MNREETENLYPCHEIEIPSNHEMNILLKMRHKHKETKKGNSRDFIIFPNLKMLKRKGLISNTNAICSENDFILKFFMPVFGYSSLCQFFKFWFISGVSEQRKWVLKAIQQAYLTDLLKPRLGRCWSSCQDVVGMTMKGVVR